MGKECVYCGTSETLTDDHVPPRCLFPEPYPPDLITVAACRNCNDGFSKHDEYFRLFLTVTDIAKGNPDREAVLPRVGRSFERSEARGFRRAFFSNVREIERFSDSGIYVGVGRVYSGDGMRLDGTVNRIVKGLFFVEKGYRLPDDHIVNALGWTRVPNLDKQVQEATREFVELLYDEAPPREVGKTFAYRWLQSPNGPSRSIWLLSFYEQPLYFCTTAPREID